jgi:hypothetical protein
VRTELYDLCRNRLGFSAIAPQPHLELCDIIEGAIEPLTKPPWRGKRQRKIAVGIPRGFFKTTIGGVGVPIHVIQKNPNITILLDAHGTEHSVETLGAIRGLAESEDFVEQFGDWRVASDNPEDIAAAWRSNAITVAQRTNKGIRQPTITCTGAEKSKVGGHYDLIIADDLVNNINCLSERLRERTRRHVGGFIPLLNPGGVILMLFTRWHLLDVYATLMRQEEKNKEYAEKHGIPYVPEWEFYVRSIWDDEGKPYFPSRFPPEAIAELRRSCTDEEFAKWYLNQAMDDKQRVFPSKLFEFFDGQVSFDGDLNATAEVTLL